jgi:hypothetical protein
VHDDLRAAVAAHVSDDGVGPSDGRDVRDKELVCVEVLHGVPADRP